MSYPARAEGLGKYDKYDKPEMNIIVVSETNSYHIGACIFHNMPDGFHKPLFHASKILLPAEDNYSQIENELLGIIFAVTNFH